MSKPQFDRCVDYVEFAARDVPAARRFYSAVFGWTFEDYGPDYASFHDGRIGGGFFTAPAGWQPSATGSGAPLVVLYAVNLEEAERRVLTAGGRVVQPIFRLSRRAPVSLHGPERQRAGDLGGMIGRRGNP